MSDWMKTCKEIGGPANVDLESCFSQKYGCEAFKKGECDFDQDVVLANIAGNTDPKDCKVFFSLHTQ